jgi:hypothetical protein
MNKQIFATLAGVLFLTLLAAGCFLLIRALWHAFANLNPQLGAALVTGFFTVTVSITAVALGRYFEKVKEVDAAYRDKRLKVYEEFVDQFFALGAAEKSTEEVDKDFTKFLRDFNKRIVLWAGSRTVRSYVSLIKKMAVNPTAAPSIFAMEGFFRSMRGDLGLDNRSLEKGDLLALILRLDELDRFIAASKTNPNVTLQEISKKLPSDK